MLDHIGFSVANVSRSKAFYSKVLAPLGIECLAEVEGWAGFGPSGGEKAELWFGEDNTTQHPMHIAFKASSRAQVDAFYAAAIAAGALCNGKPGLRKVYHPHYYGAFVLDPDGHNIEAVCHSAEDID